MVCLCQIIAYLPIDLRHRASPSNSFIHYLANQIFLPQSKKLEWFFLLGGVVEVRDQVFPVLLLLEAGEDHLRAGNVLLGVRQIHVESVRSPDDAWGRARRVMDAFLILPRSVLN